MAVAELRAFSLTGGSSRVEDRNLLLKEKVTIRQCLVSRSPRQKAADGVTRRWEERGGAPGNCSFFLSAPPCLRVTLLPRKNLVARPILASTRSGIASFSISRQLADSNLPAHEIIATSPVGTHPAPTFPFFLEEFRRPLHRSYPNRTFP